MHRARQQHKIGEPLARWHLANKLIEATRAVESERQRVGKSVFIIVLQVTRLHVRALHRLRHGGRIFRCNRFYERVGLLERTAHDIPSRPPLRRIDVLAQNLVVRHEDLFRHLVIAEVAQMHEQSHHIVGRSESRHIVGEISCGDSLSAAAHHAHDSIAQTFVVQIDVDFQRLVRFRPIPIAAVAL